MLRAGPVRMQKKERSEMTGHEGGENMKRKSKETVCKGERMKGGNEMEGLETNDTKPHKGGPGQT